MEISFRFLFPEKSRFSIMIVGISQLLVKDIFNESLLVSSYFHGFFFGNIECIGVLRACFVKQR